MIRWLLCVAATLALLSACNRRDRPVVRQTTSHAGEDRAGDSTVSQPPVDDNDAHPNTKMSKHSRRPPTPAKKAAPIDMADAESAKVTAKAPAKSEPAAETKPATKDDAKKTAASTEKPAEKTDKPNDEKATVTVGKMGKAPATSKAPVDPSSREVKMDDVLLHAPKTWTREQPAIGVIVAQFAVPRASGVTSDATVTVTKAAGATDPDSLADLRHQIKELSSEGPVEKITMAGNEIFIVDSTDEDNEPGDDGQPPIGKTRQLNATVFLGDKAAFYVNITGPEKTVTEQSAAFHTFLKSMQPVD